MHVDYEEDDGWAMGEFNNQLGWFPSNFVEAVQMNSRKLALERWKKEREAGKAQREIELQKHKARQEERERLKREEEMRFRGHWTPALRNPIAQSFVPSPSAFVPQEEDDSYWRREGEGEGESGGDESGDGGDVVPEGIANHKNKPLPAPHPSVPSSVMSHQARPLPNPMLGYMLTATSSAITTTNTTTTTTQEESVLSDVPVQERVLPKFFYWNIKFILTSNFLSPPPAPPISFLLNS